MYNSPIEMIIGNMQMQQDGEIFRAVQKIGVNVDKDELLKALQYDRGQYDKGYKDGIKEFAELVKENHNRLFNVIYSEMIDSLVKEMTEGKNG
jgi:flagellar biosynthesis regulator FlbT